MDRWSFHYLVSLGIAVGNTIILVVVFGLKTQDGDAFVLSLTQIRLLIGLGLVDRMFGTDWASAARTGD